MQPTLRLIQPHRHAGRDYPAGATVSLPERKAQWLIGLGVARPDAAAATPAEKPAEKPAGKHTKE